MATDQPVERPEPVRATDARRDVVLVTGLSGAGNTTVLKALEDLGYEAIDNLPLALAGVVIDRAEDRERPIAIGIDCRTRDFTAASLQDQLVALRRRADLSVRLIFVDCEEEVLQRRFTETRRRHPLAIDRPVVSGIQQERAILMPIRDQADRLIDTSMMTIHQLRRMVETEFTLAPGTGLFVIVTSFSYRRGLPREADLVFDVRFLENPHWDLDLRPLTGLDERVQRYIAADPDFAKFFDGLVGLLGPLLPRYNREGKRYLTLAIGCTGGKHRSVFVTERLAAWLRGRGLRVGIVHRDIPQTEPKGG